MKLSPVHQTITVMTFGSFSLLYILFIVHELGHIVIQLIYGIPVNLIADPIGLHTNTVDAFHIRDQYGMTAAVLLLLAGVGSASIYFGLITLCAVLVLERHFKLVYSKVDYLMVKNMLIGFFGLVMISVLLGSFQDLQLLVRIVLNLG